MTQVQGNGNTFADYHQVQLGDPERGVDLEAAMSGKFIEPLPGGGGVVHLGVTLGPARYEWEFHRSAPAANLTDWQDVGEAVIEAPTGVLRLFPLMCSEPVSDNMALAGAGLYVVRFSGVGRDSDYDLVVETTDERFRLDVWPATGQETTRTLKVGSVRGAEMVR